MTDLNVMMKEQARSGLQAQLDKAVTDGDTAAATKIAEDIAKLAVSTAPKPPPFTDADIRAVLDKQEWFGTDPRKSAKAVEFGKSMDPKKYATAQAFADAVIKAVDDEFKPAGGAAAASDDDNGSDDDAGTDADDDNGTDGGKAAPQKKPPKRTDGPGEGDNNVRGARGSNGPWTKLSDAPTAIQADIKRQADKFVPSSAPKEQRENFIKKALESHYAQQQRNKGKK